LLLIEENLSRKNMSFAESSLVRIVRHILHEGGRLLDALHNYIQRQLRREALRNYLHEWDLRLAAVFPWQDKRLGLLPLALGLLVVFAHTGGGIWHWSVFVGTLLLVGYYLIRE
jgi:hypothetical protein